MTRKQQEAKETAELSFPGNKTCAIRIFVSLMGYDTYSLISFPKTWKEAIDRFK